MLEVQIKAKDGHVFVVKIGSILESPKVGDSIKCGICGKTTEILRVGVPYKTERVQYPADDNQSSLFKE